MKSFKDIKIGENLLISGRSFKKIDETSASRSGRTKTIDPNNFFRVETFYCDVPEGEYYDREYGNMWIRKGDEPTRPSLSTIVFY